MLLTKLQKKTERLKICKSPTNDTKNYTIGILGNSTSNDSSKEEKMLNDRLKPPPDLINYERKKIRLNRISGKAEQSSSELDKIVIKKRKYSDSSDSSSDKNNLNVINKPIEQCVNSPTNIDVPSEADPENLHSRVRSNGTKSKKPAKVSLKRNHLTSEVQSNTEAESSSELNKKRKPITWP
ncbi:hypothetical protein J6590_036311 [Homalodisca vitripennis]|nr:hypothetical protein J6590_036311 [Homalodisca vitripennis]